MVKLGVRQPTTLTPLRPPQPCAHLLQPPDLLLLLLQAKPRLLMLHLQLLPPLGHLPHVLKHKSPCQGPSPAPLFLQKMQDEGASDTVCSTYSLSKRKLRLEKGRAGGTRTRSTPQCPTECHGPTFSLCQGPMPPPPPPAQAPHLQHLLQALQLALQAPALEKGRVPLLRHSQELAPQLHVLPFHLESGQRQGVQGVSLTPSILTRVRVCFLL